MKLPIMMGLTVFALVGCANDSESQRANADDWNETAVEKADESRAESDQTVYDESATGGSGVNESVTTDEGVRWDTLEEPREDEPTLPEHPDQPSIEEQQGESTVKEEPRD